MALDRAANRHQKLKITGIGIGIGLQASNWIMANMALYAIEKEFATNLIVLQWIINSFGLLSTVLLVLMGRLADHYGRVRLYSIGFLLAICGSLVAGFAPNPFWIIAGQGIWGIAAAILMPISQVLMLHTFPHEKKGKAIGIWASILTFSFSFSLILSGLMVDFIGWRSVFLWNVPILIIGLILTKCYVQESKNKTKKENFDFLGTALLITTLASFVLAIMQGPVWGWLSLKTVTFALVFVFSLCFLIYVERGVSAPVFEFKMFFHRTFLLSSICICSLVFLIWTIFFIFPLYLQEVQGYSAIKSSWMMLLFTIPMTVISHYAGKMYAKIGAKTLAVSGFLVLLLSFATQLFLKPSGGFWIIIAASIFFGIGFALVSGPVTLAALSSHPRNVAGHAAGTFTTMQEMGGTLGVAMAGVVMGLGNPLFMAGFHHVQWLLVGIALVGLASAAALRSHNKISRIQG